jgi:hypothetical protein
MVEEYHITPWMEHYGSMVDLRRSGMLEEVFGFALAMPANPVIWSRRQVTVLGCLTLKSMEKIMEKASLQRSFNAAPVTFHTPLL